MLIPGRIENISRCRRKKSNTDKSYPIHVGNGHYVPGQTSLSPKSIIIIAKDNRQISGANEAFLVLFLQQEADDPLYQNLY